MSELIDNKAERIQTLKHIIRHLHAGQAPEQVKKQMRELVGATDYSEIMAMEQQLIAEGMPIDEIRSMCDLHSQVARETLVQIAPRREIAPGHPVDTFKHENEALRACAAAMRAAAAEANALNAGQEFAPIRLRLLQSYGELMDIDKHYQRKEHALFSCLERHGITGPPKVMWAKDDEIRSSLKQLGAMLHDCNSGESLKNAAVAGERSAAAVEEMIFKEDNILLPLALDTLTEDEWAEIWLASPQYGWCLVEPRIGYAPTAAARSAVPGLPEAGTITLPTGRLTVGQLQAVFSSLPLDLTFVDADDRVAFFTEGPQRIFARSKAVIGRKVQNCHPPRSVEVVDRILQDFRSGQRNVAEFWIDFQGKFVHIRYFAVRDEKGTYLGTLELTQDLAPLRKLEGERRLLQYD
jgi:hypothetical protein